MNKSPAAVLFDLDGTLIDTAPDLGAALNRTRADEGLPALSATAIRSTVSHGSVAMIRLGFGDGQPDAQFEQRRQRLLAHYHDNIAEHSTLFPGMDAILEQLEAAGRAWGIVTNKPGWLTTPLLAALALDKRAACTLSGDSVARAKPHPDPLLAAAREIGLAPDACLYVGDAERDVAAARAANMPVLVARYGYLGANDEPERWAADGIIDAPADLARWIR